ncbi:MAG: tRNA 5-methoxyuridine(34)/uridine 5-oxyacetic acid(34) synthase CmoB [Pseudomonadota bacterium]
MQPDLTEDTLRQQLLDSPFADDTDALLAALEPPAFHHGDRTRWAKALGRLPPVTDTIIQTDSDAVGVTGESDSAAMTHALRGLMPWRKGPLQFGPVNIDTEWRSDWKWQRIAPALASLDGRRVLDVGGGNGYFCWRLLGAGASATLNVDPTLLFYAQHCALQHYLKRPQVAMIPCRFERLPALPDFDTVMSMGVLYHRRDPLAHLQQLRERLRPGGQLILETLVVTGDADTVLMPTDRYARMRNVWFLPAVQALERWLSRLGFKNIECVDITPTSTDEQRTTQWMTFESLAEALKPQDHTRTIEDHPAPLRAVMSAIRN